MPASSLSSPPMLNFFDKPFLDISIRFCKKNKISKVTLATESVMSDLSDYLSCCPYENTDVQCVTAENQSVSFELNEAEEPGVMFPGLFVSDMDISDAIQFHQSHRHPVTIILPTTQKEPAKATEITVAQFLGEYSPKNCCYLLRSPNHYTLTTRETEAFPILLPLDTTIGICHLNGYFKTVTSLEDYVTVLKESLENEWLFSPYQTNNGVILNKNTFLEVGAKIKPPVYIGEHVSIKKNAEILPYSILCRNSEVGENVKISDSVILEDCQIMENASLFGTLLGEHCTIEENAIISQGSRYGAYSRISNEPVQNEPPFSPATPSDEFSVKDVPIPVPKKNTHDFFKALGTACQQVFGNGTLGVFRDDSICSELFSHSLQSGLQASGISLYQFPRCTLAMAKSACPFYHLKAGLYLYEENHTVFLAIFDEKGFFISGEIQKKLTAAIKSPKEAIPEKIHSITAVKPYQLYYYTEITRRLGSKSLECYLTLDASAMIEEYVRKIATCHRITLLSEERPGVIRFRTNGAGTDFAIFDENNHSLTKRQIMALIAELMIADGENDFAVTIMTPEIIRQTLNKHRINLLETENNPHSLDVTLSHIASQQYLTYDPIYLMIKILFYLSDRHLTLAQWTATLPKSFLIEKSVTCTEQLNETITKLLKLAKNSYTKENGQYKITSKKGTTRITPEKNRIKITSESEREEYAKELTDFFVAQCEENHPL